MGQYITGAQLASYLQLAAGAIDEDALVIEFTNGMITDLVGELGLPYPWRVKALALEVAARGSRNPQAYTSVTVGIDDYDKTVRREGKNVEKFGLYLTDEERAELLSYKGTGNPRRVGSIRLSVPHVP